MDDQYWINLPTAELGPKVRERFDGYIEELDRRGRLDTYRTAIRRYYGEDHSGFADSIEVVHGGEQGETSEVVVNHYRSIVTSLLSLTTASRPAFVGVATNDSADAAASVQLAEQLWDHELEQGAETELVDAVRRMLILQEAAVLVTWDPHAGAVVGREEVPKLGEDGQPEVERVEVEVPRELDGRPLRGEAGEQLVEMQEVERPVMEARDIRAGEAEVLAVSPYDVARDLAARSVRDAKWVIARRRMNKWDLAALYPEFTEECLGAPSTDKDDLDRGLWKGAAGPTGERYSDQVYVMELYAERTPAVPEGRYARVVGETVLEHGPLPYPEIPLVMMTPETTIDVALGSAATQDLLGVQQAYDGVMNNLLSNNAAFGLSNIVVAEGQDVDVEDISGGLRLIEHKSIEGAREPHAMDLPRLSDADMKFAEMLQQGMQVISAVNDVVRGDPQASLKSGAALALVQAMAVQHNSPIQKAYASGLTAVANRILDCYKAFATEERVIAVSGTDQVRTARHFTNSDLMAVREVRVELGNPMLRTLAGKQELANVLADPKMAWPEGPLTRRQYIALLETGRWQPIVGRAMDRTIAVKEDMEQLAKGEMPDVLKTDPHELCIEQAIYLLDGRQRRELSPQVIGNVQTYIQQHTMFWQQLTMMEPHLLIATGQNPFPMPGPPPGIGGPPGPGGPPPGGGEPPPPPEAMQPPPAGPASVPGTADEVEGAGQPGMPNLPQMPGGGAPPIAGVQ